MKKQSKQNKKISCQKLFPQNCFRAFEKKRVMDDWKEGQNFAAPIVMSTQKGKRP
jgi:hypothetical protein